MASITQFEQTNYKLTKKKRCELLVEKQRRKLLFYQQINLMLSNSKITINNELENSKKIQQFRNNTTESNDP